MPNRANELSLSWLKPAESRADVALEPSAFPSQGTSSAPLFLAQLTQLSGAEPSCGNTSADG